MDAGLNCGWNRRWEESELFSEVFVPPCADDSGSAIGTAVDALVQTGHPCSLEWDVYRGAPFIDDTVPTGWVKSPMDPAVVAMLLESGHIVAWVQGRCEIVPSCPGHRSLLASPRDASTRGRLNEMKGRESYRPIAPVCLEEDLPRWFDRARSDEHMLYLLTVLRPTEVAAITHVDGSARVQAVTPTSCPTLHAVLVAHRAHTGIGMLCNTSLNHKGRGFLNRTSELVRYCEDRNIDHFVIDDVLFTRVSGRTL